MPDREKVIKGLEICIPMKYETNEEKECRHEQCPYGRENYKPMNGCFWDLMSDALVLLKEQEAQKFFVDESGKVTSFPVVVRCKDCKHRGDRHKCIVAFVAEKQEMPYFFYDNRGEWYCADGERRTDDA
jgi:hypothetical protein